MNALKTLAVATALFATGAQAQIIDFNEFAHDGDSAGYVTIESGGFLFRGGLEVEGELFVRGRTHSNQADQGNAAMAAGLDVSIIEMVRTSGARIFDLTSIDFADALNEGKSSTFAFMFTYADETYGHAQITLDDQIGLQTFTFNQTGLTHVVWRNIEGDAGQFDNINVTPVMAPVPEPETYALMLAGLSVVGWMARRRRPQQ